MPSQSRVNVNMNLDEYEKLKKAAEKAGKSLPSFLKDTTLSSLPEDDELGVLPEFKNPAARRDKDIYVSVSEEEHALIKALAGNRPMAAYVREAALSGKKTIHYDIYDEDILYLIREVEPKLTQILQGMKFLVAQNQLLPQQYEKWTQTIDELSENIREMRNQTMKNRQSIKASRLRELRRRSQAAIEKNENYKAVFNPNPDESDFSWGEE